MCSHKTIKYEVSPVQIAYTESRKVAYYFVDQLCTECNRRIRVLTVEMDSWNIDLVKQYRSEAVSFYE